MVTLTTHLKDTISQAQLAVLETQLLGVDMPDCVVGAFIDACHLPCPMPLLKAKVTLKQVVDGESLYLIASDKNSQTDLVAFCQKNTLSVHTWQTAHLQTTLFHFIITKDYPLTA